MIITVDGRIYTESGIINLPDLFKQILSIFKHLELKEFKYTKDKLIVEFAFELPVETYNRYQELLKKFTGKVSLTFSPTRLELSITNSTNEDKNQKIDSENNNEIKQENQTQNEDDNSKDIENDDGVEKIVVTKKLKNLEAGKYYIDFNKQKIGWVLIYTISGKRIPVKEPGIIEVDEKIKSITPISNKK